MILQELGDAWYRRGVRRPSSRRHGLVCRPRDGDDDDHCQSRTHCGGSASYRPSLGLSSLSGVPWASLTPSTVTTTRWLRGRPCQDGCLTATTSSKVLYFIPVENKSRMANRRAMDGLWARGGKSGSRRMGGGRRGRPALYVCTAPGGLAGILFGTPSTLPTPPSPNACLSYCWSVCYQFLASNPSARPNCESRRSIRCLYTDMVRIVPKSA